MLRVLNVKKVLNKSSLNATKPKTTFESNTFGFEKKISEQYFKRAFRIKSKEIYILLTRVRKLGNFTCFTWN